LAAGFATADITPPVGYSMWGSLYPQVSTGTTDPLYVKVMTLRQGQTRGALVICDLGYVSRSVTEPARRLSAERTGIPPENIVICATHTHGGPEYDGTLRDLRHDAVLRVQGEDPLEPINYSKQLVQQIADTVQAAAAAERPVTIASVVAEQLNLSFNRRFHMRDGSVRFNPGKRNPDIIRPAGPIDPELPWILFCDARTDEPIGSLTVFAMHVATFYKNNTWGADYPGVLQRELNNHFGDRFVSLFGQGTCGDINHIDVSNNEPQNGATEPIRIGQTLAATLLTALPNLHRAAEPAFKMRSQIVEAPLQSMTPEQVKQAYEVLSREPRAVSFLERVEAWKVLNTRRLHEEHGETFPMEVNALRLAPQIAVVSLPEEIFVEIGLEIKRRSPFSQTLVISMAHDLDFYVPTRKAFAEGSYEIVTSCIEPGSGEMLVEAAVSLLEELAQ
jgi:hypothetical protein